MPSAFPVLLSAWDDHERSIFDVAPGMDLRDWFAGQAIQGLLAAYGREQRAITDWAKQAYEVADAMLREREKGGQ